MFNKILIANRGEIAVRIIAACRDLGIATVAVHSEADRECLHVALADQSVCIGPAQSDGSYLNQTSVLSAARTTGAEAIHPGYGFLAENAVFAEVTGESGLTFIGPTPEAIRLMGNKAEARKTVAAAGVPVVPGSDGPVSGIAAALEVADEIGYPVILKASSGGGGRGPKPLHSPPARIRRGDEPPRLRRQGSIMNRSRAIAIFVAAAFAALSQAAFSGEADPGLRLAARYLKAGALEDACQASRGAVAAEPGSAPADWQAVTRRQIGMRYRCFNPPSSGKTGSDFQHCLTQVHSIGVRLILQIQRVTWNGRASSGRACSGPGHGARFNTS